MSGRDTKAGASAPDEGPAEKRRTLVHLSGVQKRYVMGDEALFALAGLDLEIQQGEFVAIMGPSGSGKSTLMNILGCLDRPTAGDYTLAGAEVSGLSDDELADVRNETIGFVFQSFHLLPRKSALDNVMLPLLYRRQNRPSRSEMVRMATASLEHVGLGDRTQHRPNEMSGGQRQRVAIARALVGAPDVILADEPTGNLDTKTTHEILELMVELWTQGSTVIVVTHEDEVGAVCERVVTLRDGKLVSDVKKGEPGHPSTWVGARGADHDALHAQNPVHADEAGEPGDVEPADRETAGTAQAARGRPA